VGKIARIIFGIVAGALRPGGRRAIWIAGRFLLVELDEIIDIHALDRAIHRGDQLLGDTVEDAFGGELIEPVIAGNKDRGKYQDESDPDLHPQTDVAPSDTLLCFRHVFLLDLN
jgi:hypothetical protein